MVFVVVLVSVGLFLLGCSFCVRCCCLVFGVVFGVVFVVIGVVLGLCLVFLWCC